MEPRTILIVEAEAAVILDLSHQLEHLGYKVGANATSGEEAVAKALAVQPDLVLIDIHLAGKINGVEAAQQILTHLDVPVIYLTAPSDEKSLACLKVMAHHRYLVKPINERELAISISSALHEHQIEQKTREQSCLLQLVLDTISDGIIVLDEQRRIVLQNAAAQRYRTVLDEIQSDDRLAAWMQELTTGSPAESYHELQAADKSGRYFQIVTTAVDHTKEPAGVAHLCQWVIVIRDISDVKQAQFSLKTSYTHFQKAQQLSQLGSFELDINTGDLIVSEGLARIAGREISGPIDFEIAKQMIHPDDIEQALKSYQGAMDRGGEPTSMEFRLIRPDSSIRFMRTATEYQHDAVGIPIRVLGVIQDITEIKETEEALRRSEALYRSLVENNPDYILCLDRDCRITFINTVAKGFELEQVIGAHAFDFIDSANLDAAKEAYESVLKGGGRFARFESPGIRRDGTPGWLDIRVTPIQDNQQITGLTLHLTDITERKQADNARAHYAQRLEGLHAIDEALRSVSTIHEISQAVLEQLCEWAICQQAGVMIFDIPSGQGTLIRMFTEKRDIEVEQWGRPGHDFPYAQLKQGEAIVLHPLSQYAPGNLFLGKRVAEGVRALATIPLIDHGDLVGLLYLGADNPAHIDKDALEVAQQVANLLAVAIQQIRLREAIQLHTIELEKRVDERTAELTQAKEHIEAILYSSSDAIVLTDISSHIVRVNPAFHKLFGFQANSALGQALTSLVDSNDVLPLQEAIAIVVSEDVVRQIDVLARRQDGTTFNAEVRLSLIVDNDRGKSGVVCNLRDITERKQFEHALRVARDELETRVQERTAELVAANAGLRKLQIEREQILGRLIHSEKMNALGRLVASIAHEINNPIQALQGCLSLVQEERAGLQRPEKLDRYLGIVESEIERIANIVRRMRDFYRPASESFGLVHVESLLQDVLELANKQLQHSNIQIVYKHQKLPPVWANANQLKQVFLNLMLNASDAMPAGGRLQITTAEGHVQEESTEQLSGSPVRPAVRIEFNDEGEGIPQSVLPHIFEPFFTTKSTGTGLGLSISYSIIKSHRGSITVNRQQDRGTSFVILLPVDDGQPKASDESGSQNSGSG